VSVPCAVVQMRPQRRPRLVATRHERNTFNSSHPYTERPTTAPLVTMAPLPQLLPSQGPDNKHMLVRTRRMPVPVAWLGKPPPRPVASDEEAGEGEQPQHLNALVELGQALVAAKYDWVCPSPDTQSLVNSRFINRKAQDLAGVFGWNRPCEPTLLSPVLPAALLQSLVEAGVLQMSLDHETLRSRVRFSSFAGTLVAHPAWPTHEAETTPFGADTYRMGAFLERELGGPSAPGWAHMTQGEIPRTVVDMSGQSGASGVLAARLLQPACPDTNGRLQVLFTDPHPRSLRFASANARLGGLSHFTCLQSNTLADVPDPIDLLLLSPACAPTPTLRSEVDTGQDPWGLQSTLDTVASALQRLAPSGRLLLCTGAPVVHGVDRLWQGLQALLGQAAEERHAVYRYQMVEPDVWGSVLTQAAYAEVERIAAVSLCVHLPLLR
jgi:hypothetical protein